MALQEPIRLIRRIVHDRLAFRRKVDLLAGIGPALRDFRAHPRVAAEMRRQPVIELHPLLKGQVEEALDECQELFGLSGSGAVTSDLEEAHVMGCVPQLVDEFRAEGTVRLACGAHVQNGDRGLVG